MTVDQPARTVRIDEASGQRIDNYLARILKGIPRSRIYQMIRKGEVRVNGGRVKPTHRLHAGDRVRIPPVRQAVNAAQAFIGERQLGVLEAAILHEDDRLLVLDKPAGLAVHGGSGVAFGAIEALRRLRPGVPLELVHRLDRDTSGVLLISKRRSTLRALHAHLRAGTVEKFYRLIVHGQWPHTLTRVEQPLTRYLTPSGERRVRVDPEGKPSLTTFEIEAHAAQATLLTAELHTGRTHQIRVHCRAAGHSILGDAKYASEAELAWDLARGVRRLSLHASRITLPEDGGVRTFEAPMPAELHTLWQRLERSAPEDG
ncbi:MAG: RluA family pseudouridine synthase [Pseudomonadales bacterium]|jgi:23S rRNA pseudouridine955/2504/2580 synthase